MTYLNFVVYQGKGGEWRWRLVTVNGRIIAHSAEGYANKHDCLDAIDLVKGSAPAPIRVAAA